jgi:hypothetical protein
MKEQRLSKRFSARLSFKLKAITSGKIKIFYVITKDISTTGAFFNSKEVSHIPNDTGFIINSLYPHKSTCKVKLKKWLPFKQLKQLKLLESCTGTIVRSTSEGIAIRFTEPVELFV